MRRVGAIILILVAAYGSSVRGQTPPAAPLSLIDVPFISQTEALCGGAAAAMVLRFWGERDVAAESFAHLLDRSASGIRTATLIGDLRQRGWDATGIAGTDAILAGELARGRPVVALIEDRPGVYHYVVVVARHDGGVVFHDPARLPFRVLAAAEFERRWVAAGRWMAVVLPRPAAEPSSANLPSSPAAVSSCDQRIADGVAAARANDFAVAERELASALSCPGPAAVRELAGVRLLQQRWSDVEALATLAVSRDPGDEYAWKLLGTARFIGDDPAGALAAWNRAGEPRLDIVRVDGLTRTRHRVVERLLNVSSGEVLTSGRLLRAQRRLAELPSASSTRLEYTPAASGRADLRGAVVERPPLPTSPLSLAALGLSAAVQREIRVTIGSMTGGGEQPFAAWRFWPERRRVAAGIRAPAPWGGVWAVEGFRERQGFTSAAIASITRGGVGVTQSNWATGRLRWMVGAGVDTWRGEGDFARVAGAVRFVSIDDRIETQGDVARWMAGRGFASWGASVRVRTSRQPQGMVWQATASTAYVSDGTPADLWPAGDTGIARPTLLRAHPVVTGSGRLRVERIGRTLQSTSVEARRWWRVAGPLRAAPAAFVDVARTSRGATGGSRGDVDAGIGGRFSSAGIPGILHINAAFGLKDDARVLSFLLVVE
jgi:hypothetical protein